MSIYRFSESSAISEVRFHTAADRAPVALLTASAKTDAAKLAALRPMLQANGWQPVAVFVDGKEQLQITGFKNPSDVTALLQRANAVEGSPQIGFEEIDLSKRTNKDWFNRSKLRIAGWLNAVGDVSLLAGGIDSKDNFMTLAGGLYTGGAVALGLYGNVKTDRQLREISQDTADFLQQRTGDLPKELGLSTILSQKKTSRLHQLEDYLYHHPADIMLGFYSAGAAAMIGSGIAHKNNERLGYGIWSLGIKLTSLLLPEKKADTDQPLAPKRTSGIGGAIDWIKEKPLRLFGYGSLVTELLLGASAMRDFKTAKNDPAKKRKATFGFFTTGMYMLSDALMATSSKDPTNADGKFNDDQQLRIEAMAAEAIAIQPEGYRSLLAKEVGGFLAQRSEIKGSREEITKAILTQAEHLGKSRWAARVEQAAHDAVAMPETAPAPAR